MRSIPRLLLLLAVYLLASVATSQAAVTSLISATQKGIIGYTDSLTAPGSTDTLTVSGYTPTINITRELTFSVRVTNINTNVVIRIVGGQQVTKMGNMSSDGTDITITSNGVYNFRIAGVPSLGCYALLFLGELGGTDAKLYVTVKAG